MYKVSITSRINPNPTYNAGFLCNQPVNIDAPTTDDLLIYDTNQWTNISATSLTGSTGPTGPAGNETVIINGVIQGPGSQTTPYLRYINDQDTGYYLRNSNELALTCNATSPFYWTSTSSNSINPLIIDTTDTKALLLRRNGNTGDIVTINTSNTTSTSTTTGGMVVVGGVGVSGNAYIESISTPTVTGSVLTIAPQRLLLNKQHAIRLSLTGNFTVPAATTTSITWSNVVYNNGFTYTPPQASVSFPVSGYYLVIVTYEFNAIVSSAMTLQLFHASAPWGITDRQSNASSPFSTQLPVLVNAGASGITCQIVIAAGCTLKGGSPGNTSVTMIRLF